MPSDSQPSPRDRTQIALAAVGGQIAAYRRAVIAAHERVRGMLAVGGGSDRAALELGPFASGRIDPARFAALEASSPALDATARSRLAAAAEVLAFLDKVDESAFVVHVPRGGDFEASLERAFERLGRAFGAAATAELIRSGRYGTTEHATFLEGCGFAAWNKADRLVAPPLVVEVDGADVRAGVLAEFLDGATHIALVVSGPCPPAPLARLVTPGTLVLQTSDDKGLSRFSAFDGPSVMALVPDDAARFIHDPAAGRSTWQRLTIWGDPPAPPRRGLGGISAWQQQQELLQLRAIAERPSLSTAPVDALVPAGGGDPADRLASWLLTASGLEAR